MSGFRSWYSYQALPLSSLYSVICKINTMLLDALSAGTTTNFSWISANSAATSGSSNTDSCRRDMVLLSTDTRLFIKDITDLTHLDRVSISRSPFLAQRRAYSSTESKINFEFCFQIKDLGFLYLGPLERMQMLTEL